MNRRAQVTFGVAGGKLALYPVEGVASAAATVAVYEAGDSNDDTAEVTGATVAMDTTSVAVSAASGYSQTRRNRINCTPTGVVVGELYWLADSTTGQHEVVKVIALGTTYVDVEYPLAYDYSTSATLKGFKHTITLGTSWLQDEDNLTPLDSPYRVLWTYTVGGVSYRHWTQFDLVRFLQEDDVGDDDLADVWADLPYTVSVETRARALREARTRLEIDIRNRGYDPANLAPGTLRGAAIRACVMVILAEQGRRPVGMDAADYLRTARGNYLRALDALPDMERLDARGEGESVNQAVHLGFVS